MSHRAHIVVPVKGLAAGKTRLAEVLSDAERIALVRRLTERTLAVACAVPETFTTVVTPDPEVAALAQAAGAGAVRRSDAGLNEALAEAAATEPAERTLVLPMDLPWLSADDLEAHIAGDAIGLSPDRRGTGTNLLSLPAPAAIPFRFGPDSARAHRDEAAKAGIAVRLIDRPGLAFDLDTADDLSQLRDWP